MPLGEKGRAQGRVGKEALVWKWSPPSKAFSTPSLIEKRDGVAGGLHVGSKS